MKGLSDKLRTLRRSRGLTQKEVAAALSITQTAYYKYEDGSVEIPVRNIIKLSKFYNIDMNELFAGVEGVSNSGTSSEAAGQTVPAAAGTVPETEEETVKLFTIEIRANKQALQNLSLRIKED